MSLPLRPVWPELLAISDIGENWPERDALAVLGRLDLSHPYIVERAVFRLFSIYGTSGNRESVTASTVFDRAALERFDFAVRRVSLIFAWKSPQELDPCLSITTQKKYHILLKRPHGTLAEKRGENGGFCSFVPRAITRKPPPLARFRRAVAT